MNGFVLLFGCVLLSALASIFLKMGASTLTEQFTFANLISNYMIWVGGFFYSTAFLGYIYVLRVVPLSLAQPVITVGVSVVTVLTATTIFREQMAMFNWLGFAFICFGVFLLFWGRT